MCILYMYMFLPISIAKTSGFPLDESDIQFKKIKMSDDDDDHDVTTQGSKICSIGTYLQDVAAIEYRSVQLSSA